jgi:hypothetical protein
LFPPLIFIFLFILGSTACQGDQDGSFPIVDDPEAEINVTPDENKYAYFTIKVVRLGTFQGIGWHAQGEIYIKVPLGAEDETDEVLVSGTGFGMAGYDASGDPCINLGGWPVDYSAAGTFNTDTCEFNIIAEESWPKTEAHAICLGYGSEVEGPPYKLVFPNLKFTSTEVLATPEPRTVDEIYWTDTFTLIPGVDADKLDCIFSDPPSAGSDSANQ